MFIDRQSKSIFEEYKSEAKNAECIDNVSKKRNKEEYIAYQTYKNMTQQLDKNYAYLKLCSRETSIAFTPSKARALRAQSRYHVKLQ